MHLISESFESPVRSAYKSAEGLINGALTFALRIKCQNVLAAYR